MYVNCFDQPIPADQYVAVAEVLADDAEVKKHTLKETEEDAVQRDMALLLLKLGRTRKQEWAR